MLHSVSLRNFKKHRSLDVAFDGGVTSVIGDNAIGKSCLLKAIMFALGGARGAGSAANLWNWDAEGQKSVALKLTLPKHGRVTITRTSGGAKVLGEAGELLASGNAAVTKFIEDSLGLAISELRPLCYSPQGETQGILTMGPTALQQKVEGMSGIAVVDQVLGRLSQDLSRMEGRLEGLQGEGVEEAKEEVRRCEGFLATHQGVLGYSKQEVERLEGEIDGLRKSISTAEAVEAKREALAKSLMREDATARRLSEELVKLNEELGQLPSVDLERISTDQEFLQDLRKLERELRDTSTKVDHLRHRREKLVGLIRATGTAMEKHEEAEQRLLSLEPALDALQKEVSSKHRDWEDLSKALSRGKEELKNAVCQSCNRPFTEGGLSTLKDNIEQVAQRKEEAKKLVDDASARLDKLKRAVSSARSELNPGMAENLAFHQKELLAVDIELNELGVVPQGALERTEKRIEEWEGIVKKWLDDLNKVKQKEEAIRVHDELYKRARESWTVLRGELYSLPDADMSAAKALLAQKKELLNEARQRLSVWETSIRQAEVELKAAIKQVEQLERVKAERADVEESKALAGQLQSYLRKNRSSFGEGLWGSLLQYASALISNTTSGRLTELSRSKDGEFYIREEGRAVPVSDSSGAQRSIIGLALRIAMTKTFYGNGLFLLLDEPTADARDNTAAAVAGMLQSLNMQVISVTHRTGDAVNAGQIIEL